VSERIPVASFDVFLHVRRRMRPVAAGAAPVVPVDQEGRGDKCRLPHAIYSSLPQCEQVYCRRLTLQALSRHPSQLEKGCQGG